MKEVRSAAKHKCSAAVLLQFIVYFGFVVSSFEQQIFADEEDDSYGYDSYQSIDHVEMFHDHLSGNGKHEHLQQVFRRMFCQHLYKFHPDDQSQDIAEKFSKLAGFYAEQGNAYEIVDHGYDQNYDHHQHDC